MTARTRTPGTPGAGLPNRVSGLRLIAEIQRLLRAHGYQRVHGKC